MGGKVIADMSMSLDGYIADPNDNIDRLIGWFFNGDVETPTANPHFTFRTSEASAARLRNGLKTIGALVGGRRYFDLARGWGGTHPIGVPVFTVTHRPPDEMPFPGEPTTPFVFVTEGVEAAVAQAQDAAGGKDVGVATPSVTRQCLDAGLLDEIQVSVIPVVLGAGIPFFADLATTPLELEDPEVVQGTGVTHLTYRVRR